MYIDELRPFLKDSQGRYRTNSLFLEPGYSYDTAVFTLKEDDHEHNGKRFLSLKKIYLEISDPSEYHFAQEVFGSWDHWQRIKNNQTLAPYIESWAVELEVKLRSEATRRMIELSNSGDSKNMAAMKWAAEGGWKEVKRGRVSKKEKEQEIKREAGIVQSIRDDLKRIGA